MKDKIKEIIFKIFGKPIPKSKGIRGTNSGKLFIDKKVFYKRADVKDVVKKIEIKHKQKFINMNNKEMPIGKVKVIRRLDNGEEIEWTCFWDNGWWDANSGVRIPNVIKWF